LPALAVRHIRLRRWHFSCITSPEKLGVIAPNVPGARLCEHSRLVEVKTDRNRLGLLVTGPGGIVTHFRAPNLWAGVAQVCSNARNGLDFGVAAVPAVPLAGPNRRPL
jgi:hypothetical protein